MQSKATEAIDDEATAGTFDIQEVVQMRLNRTDSVQSSTNQRTREEQRNSNMLQLDNKIHLVANKEMMIEHEQTCTPPRHVVKDTTYANVPEGETSIILRDKAKMTTKNAAGVDVHLEQFD